jgi:hypothetical protein
MKKGALQSPSPFFPIAKDQRMVSTASVTGAVTSF